MSKNESEKSKISSGNGVLVHWF